MLYSTTKFVLALACVSQSDPCRLWDEENIMQKATAAVDQGGASICHAADSEVWHTFYNTSESVA